MLELLYSRPASKTHLFGSIFIMPHSTQVCAIIPAYNEAAAIGLVVDGLLALKYEGKALFSSVVVCNNASVDDTTERAIKAGAEVISEQRPGYGYACQAGIDYCSVNYPETDVLIFVDGDDSCDYGSIPLLLETLLDKADLVIGSRALASNEAGALTRPQVWGNRLAAFLVGRLWGAKITDLGPLRAIRCDVIRTLQLREMTFGWTVEMQVKAILKGFRVCEVPSGSRRRIGQSKISGTVRGTVLAAHGILGTIFKLWWQSKDKRA